MNYEEERKRYISYCGSYCHQCDWHTGKIRKIYGKALEMLDTYQFKKLFKNTNIDAVNFRKGLELLANSSICSGCKAEVAKSPIEDRCEVRACCHAKGFDLCMECSEFACDKLKSNPGVIKFHCIENLLEIRTMGIERWVDEQWKTRREK